MKPRVILSTVCLWILLTITVGTIGGAADGDKFGSPAVGHSAVPLSPETASDPIIPSSPNIRVVPDVVEAFNQLTQQGEWQGIYPNHAPFTREICTCITKSLEHPEYEDWELPLPVDLCMPCPYDPTDCCTTRTLHFQGVARHPRAGSKAIFYLSRAGEPGNRVFDSEGVLWIAEVDGGVYPSAQEGERIGSTRLEKGKETKDTINHLNKLVVNWIDFDEYLDNPWGTPPGRLDYDHPGGMQAVDNVLAVALSGRNDDSLPEGKVAFFDISDPIQPVPFKTEISIPQFKPGYVGLAYHPVLRIYFAIVGVSGYNQQYIYIYKSNYSDFHYPGFKFEFYDAIMQAELETLAGDGWYQMEPSPQSMNIVVGANNRLYVIGATNTKLTAPIIDGTNRMWLWELGLPGMDRAYTELIPIAKADKNLRSYGDPSEDNSVCHDLTNNLEKQEANFAAGSGAYVSPTGELLYYGVSYWNLGIGGLARMAELRSKYVSHTKTCGYQLQDDHLGGPHNIDEGSMLYFDDDIPAVYPWVHMYDAKDFGPGNQVMMDFSVQFEDDYRDFSRLDGENGFKDDMSSFRFCGNPGSTLEIYDATPSNTGTWEEQWEKAKEGNDGWIQCEGTGEVIEVPNLSALGDHCSHLDSTDSDDFDGDADSARLLWGDLPPREWRVEGDSGASLENVGSKKLFKAGPGNYIVYLKIADKEERAYVNVTNLPPEIESLDVTPGVLDEGQEVTLSATWSDPGAPVVNAKVYWGDGQVSENSAECYDCSPGPYSGPIEFKYVYADNGEYQVEICFDDDLEDNILAVCESRPVTVNNVAPTFSLGSGEAIDEAGTFTLPPISFNDKGTADTHTATIDWGDILPKDPNNAELGDVDEAPFGPPGSIDGAGGVVGGSSFVYGDNSIYTVEVCVMDDDGGTICDHLEVTVNNIDPALLFDKSAALPFAGGPAFLARRGVEQTFISEASDTGSDDLTYTWTFLPSALGTATTYFNNDTSPDPAHSPGGIFPFSSADTNFTTFAAPGVYEVIVEGADDDNGYTSDSLPLLVTDSRGCTASRSSWGHEYGAGGKQTIDDQHLQGYLDLIRFASAYFDDGNLADLADAAAIFSAKGSSDANHLKQHALAAWLNFASGGILWDQQIRHLEGPFYEVIDDIDAVLLNPDATKKDLVDAQQDAIRINTSKSSNSICNDAGTP